MGIIIAGGAAGLAMASSGKIPNYEPWGRAASPWAVHFWMMVVFCAGVCTEPLGLWLSVAVVGSAWYYSRWRGWSWVATVAATMSYPIFAMVGLSVAGYAGGAPVLWGHLRASNRMLCVDRETRAFHQGGWSCGGEAAWVNWLHDAPIRMLCHILGPPRHSYDGPFPTLEEAQAVLKEGQAVQLADFYRGNLQVEGETIVLGKDITERLAGGLHLLLGVDEDDLKEWERPILRAAVFQQRCLVLRVTGFELTDRPQNPARVEVDLILLLDRTNLRPITLLGLPDHRWTVYLRANYRDGWE